MGHVRFSACCGGDRGTSQVRQGPPPPGNPSLRSRSMQARGSSFGGFRVSIYAGVMALGLACVSNPPRPNGLDDTGGTGGEGGSGGIEATAGAGGSSGSGGRAGSGGAGGKGGSSGTG